MSSLSPLLNKLLTNRGITAPDVIEKFLNPNYDTDLHDPFLLPDMEKAVLRVLKAIEDNERIICYTDYDTDGTPAGVILHDFFKKIGYSNFSNYIPHRHREGYGLNIGAIEKFSSEGAKLIITADCGITDVREVERANELGIDCIITDHHLPHLPDGKAGKILPPAYAVINPKRQDSTYPFDMLCGSAVAFKLVQALLARGKELGLFDIPDGWEKWLLDMVGIATISDMVPLIGENRVLAYYGLRVLRKSPRPGLQKLFRTMRIDQRHITEMDIGFTLGPRINAASRMDDPIHGFNFLSTRDVLEAGQILSHLNKLNDRRKGLVALVVKEARKRVEGTQMREIIVMGNPLWQPGILGLAANTLMRECGKPVFLWGRGEGAETIKGSCRSDGSINVVEFMGTVADIFIDFGGHESAGGFSVDHDKIHTFEDKLNEAYDLVPKKEVNKEEFVIDGALSLDDVNWETYRVIEQLAPFGVGNPQPIFLFKNVEIIMAERFGKDKAHLKLSFANSRGAKINAVSFFASRACLPARQEKFEKCEQGERINLIASLEKNIFRNAMELRLRIVDVT